MQRDAISRDIAIIYRGKEEGSTDCRRCPYYHQRHHRGIIIVIIVFVSRDKTFVHDFSMRASIRRVYGAAKISERNLSIRRTRTLSGVSSLGSPASSLLRPSFHRFLFHPLVSLFLYHPKKESG